MNQVQFSRTSRATSNMKKFMMVYPVQQTIQVHNSERYKKNQKLFLTRKDALDSRKTKIL